MYKRIFLSIIIMGVIFYGCDCGGGPDWVLNDTTQIADGVTDIISDIKGDALSDIHQEDVSIDADATIDTADVSEDILDTLPDSEDISDITEDISEDTTDISDTTTNDTQEDILTDTEQDTSISDVSEDADQDAANEDVTTDTTNDGGVASTIIKECPKSPNNSNSVVFEFLNPDATSFECKLNNSDWITCTSPYQIPNSEITTIPDGDNSFFVRAIFSGTPEEDAAFCSWVKDTVAPDTTLVNNPSFECLNYVEIEAECSEPNSNFEYSLDNNQWINTTSSTYIEGLPDGQHNLKVRCVDQAGNVDQTPISYSWITDTTSPSISLDQKPQTITQNKNATFIFTSSDPSAIFMCSLDSAQFAFCTSPVNLNNLSEGSHNFSLYSVDQCSNKSTIVDYSWIIDSTAPESTITIKPSSLSNNINPSFEFTCSENGKAECSLDSAAYSLCISPISYTNLSEGIHSFAVRCIDDAGNIDPTPATYSWQIDATPPDTMLTLKPQDPTKFNTATFEFTCSENGFAECSLDSDSYTNCTSPVLYTNLQDGNHTFSVRCVDDAQNRDPTPETYNWLIDTTPPVTSITEKPANPTKSTSATFRFSCNENGTLECRLDGQTWSICTSPRVYTGLSNGAHLFSARCTDTVGNIETSPPVYTWVVDTIAPDTYITSNPPAITNNTTANFSFNSNETEVTYECSLDQGIYSVCQQNHTINNLSEGNHTLCTRAIDKALNTDPTPACYNWEVDTTQPNTIILTYPSNPTNSTTALFTFDSDEAGSTFECSLDNAPFTPCTSPKQYTGITDGTHIFRVRATDTAANTDPTPAEYTWQVILQASSTTILTYPPNPSNSTSATFTFSCGDPSSTYECSLDGSLWTPCSSPITYNGLSESTHIFRVRSKDTLGNVEQNPPQYIWQIDITPPDTAITSYPPDPTNNSAPSFSFISSETNSTFECSYDLGIYFTCSSPHTWTNIPEGLRYFNVRAVDAAGNTDPTPSQYSFNVDLTPPETYIVNKPTNPTNQTNATFTFYSNESNTTFECNLNNEGWQPCTSPQNYNLLSNGNHLFMVRAKDNAGNTDPTPDEYQWKVDNIPPDTLILTNPPSITNSKNATFTFDCTDDTLPCTFECSLDGGGYSLCVSPVQYQSLGDGNHTFRVRAIDAAQNTDPDPAQYTWRVDTIAPQAFIDSMPGNPSLIKNATFTFHCNETATTECSLDTSGYSSCVSPIDYTNLSVGTHTFRVRCIDLAQNISSPAQYTWDIMVFNIEKVDAPKFFTNFFNRSIKTDSQNMPHIVYGGDNLYHAYQSESNFIVETIDNSFGLGEYASLFIDTNDYMHISYYNPTNLSLMYATNAGGVWSKTTVDAGNNVGYYSSIAVDQNGFAHIAYYDNTTYDLKYATNKSGAWVTTVVESEYVSGEYCSIALDSLGNPHIAYYKRNFPTNKGVLRYATRSGASWNIQTLDDQGDGRYVGLFTSIAIDKFDNIHISYFDNINQDLKYITGNSLGWSTPIFVETTNDVGRYSSLVVDNNGFAHITYYNNSNGTLRYANNTTGNFLVQLVDNTASVGTYNSLAIDKLGKLHASYYDATNAKLKYAMRLTSGTWTNFRHIDTSGSVGQYPSIYLDSLKRPHICYYDAFYNGELKYAYKENGIWNISTIDNGGVSNYQVGRYCNIKTDTQNKVHISYLDTSRSNIKHITNSSGTWASENPDNINTVGQFQTSLAIDLNGKIHISYYDSSNGGELRYSNNVDGYWLPIIVDNGGAANANVGQYNSIAVDRNGFVHISYYDTTNQDLKYATNVSGDFVTYTVDSTGSVGAYTAIALDSNGYPVISYYDAAPNYNLKVAVFDGVSWGISVADSSANNVGLYTSVSLDQNNKIHIAYFDATTNKIKYATNKYGSWQNFVIDNNGRLGTNGYTTGIFATPSGMVYIVYYDYLLRDLKYATNEN